MADVNERRGTRDARGGSAAPSASRTRALRAQPIVALDVPSLNAARDLMARVGRQADFVKVGLELFTAEGPRVVDWLLSDGRRVFLDLKLHDIPTTVRGAARSAASMGVSLLTVHAYGGADMIAAAVEGAAEGSRGGAGGVAGGIAGDAATTGILAVTVLTSLDADALATSLGRDRLDVEAEVLRLAATAASVGAHGIVCSGHEVHRVRTAHPTLAPLVPGIRLAGGASHDQARITTPERAAADGATYLVLGRAITAAPDPQATLAKVLESLQA